MPDMKIVAKVALGASAALACVVLVFFGAIQKVGLPMILAALGLVCGATLVTGALLVLMLLESEEEDH